MPIRYKHTWTHLALCYDTLSGIKTLFIVTTVVPSLGAVETVRLHYRIGFGPETLLDMSPDALSQFAASIPAAAYEVGELVRWRIVATGEGETLSVDPTYYDPLNDPEYFGTMVTGRTHTTQLPTLRGFTDDTAGADTRDGTHSAVFFEGLLYDNVFTRVRGQTTEDWPKHKYTFDFHPGHHFKWRADRPAVEEFNLNSSTRTTTCARTATLPSSTKRAHPTRRRPTGGYAGTAAASACFRLLSRSMRISSSGTTTTPMARCTRRWAFPPTSPRIQPRLNTGR
jgi:hypothetical protein